jgi:hypothetical protein
MEIYITIKSADEIWITNDNEWCLASLWRKEGESSADFAQRAIEEELRQEVQVQELYDIFKIEEE